MAEVSVETNKANVTEGQITGRKRKRKAASKDDESHQIVPTKVKMSDLVKDRGLGKPSRTETEMAKIDWAEVKKKRRLAEEEALQEELKQKEAKKNGFTLPAPGPHAAERLVLVSGQMLVDESSRVIDRNAATARDAELVEDAISEDRLTRRVNQATVGRKLGRVKNYTTWNDEETEQFYQGLRMFGTDFMMISKMFSGTSRAMIKKKYNKEEKLNAERILTALNSKEPVDLASFSEMTDTVYKDPQDFYKELEEEQLRLEAEDAKSRAEEAKDDQEAHHSTEHEDRDGLIGEEPVECEMPTTMKNRFAVDAQVIMDGATPGKTRSKKTPSAKKKEGRKSKIVPAEGTEEILGSIENFEP